jgi:hypothetical protein
MADAPQRPLDQHLNKARATSCAVIGLLLTVGAAFVLSTQIYGWFRAGTWHEVPTGVILLALPEALRSWFANPTAWLGLRNMLDSVLHLPLTLCLLIVGGIFIAIFGALLYALGLASIVMLQAPGGVRAQDAPKVQIPQPGVPQNFDVLLQNTGNN